MSRWLYKAFTVVAALSWVGSAAAQAPLQLNYQQPQKFEIAEINVEGLEYLDERALISLSGLKVGDEIEVPGSRITSAVERLWKQGIIGDVTIEATQVVGKRIFLTIKLTERPRLARYTITGLNRTQRDDLEEEFDLIRGRIVTDALLKNTELTIRNYLLEKGFLNAEIDMKQRSDTLVSNGIRIDIIVKRNPKVNIESITFYGNEEFSDTRLRNKMKKTNEHLRFHLPKEVVLQASQVTPRKVADFFTKDYQVSWGDFRNWWGSQVNLNFFKSTKFVPDEYENDKKALIGFYNSQGFRDATIVEDTIYDHDSNSLNVDITVDEGQRYYFRNIDWTGNYIHDDEVLASVLGIQKGDIYDRSLVDKRLNFNPNGADVSSIYMDDGYLAFNATPIEVKIVGDSIDLEMRVSEGNQFYLNDVSVSGNSITNDHVVLREVRTLPGDKFSRQMIIRTQRELSQLGFFNPETITPNVQPNFEDNTVDLEWQLEEQHSSQVELSGGWGGFYGLVGTLGLSFNNFSARNIFNFRSWRPVPLGDGQTLSLRAQANGRNFQLYSLSFTEPWLGGRRPNSFSFNLNYSVQRATDFGATGFGTFGNSFDFRNATITGSLKLISAGVTYGRRISWPDDFFTLAHTFTYTRYVLEEFGQTLGFSTGDANNFSLTTTLARNSVSSPIFPRNGSSLSLALTLTPPYSLFRDLDYENAEAQERYEWIEYHKWMFDSKHYMTIVGNLVLAARAHLGFIGSYTEAAGIGPFERFWLGGDGLAGQNILLGTDIIGLRGYENSSIVPVDPINQIRGGVVYNKFVWELRYLVSPNPSATIYLHGFAEAGNNWDDYRDFNPFNLRRSAGLGVRIFMPAFGLLGIDWGYGFDDDLRNPGTISGSQVHFSIGQTLR